jgi:hypothetical protein
MSERAMEKYEIRGSCPKCGHLGVYDMKLDPLWPDRNKPAPYALDFTCKYGHPFSIFVTSRDDLLSLLEFQKNSPSQLRFCEKPKPKEQATWNGKVV